MQRGLLGRSFLLQRDEGRRRPMVGLMGITQVYRSSRGIVIIPDAKTRRSGYRCFSIHMERGLSCFKKRIISMGWMCLATNFVWLLEPEWGSLYQTVSRVPYIGTPQFLKTFPNSVLRHQSLLVRWAWFAVISRMRGSQSLSCNVSMRRVNVSVC